MRWATTTEQRRSGSSTTLAHIGNLGCYCTTHGRCDPSQRAPVTLRVAHAIELYLKAFLRLRGVGIDEVKNSFGHDFKKLVDEASSRGLSLVAEDRDIAAILTEKESIRRAAYIETGYYQRPRLAALSRTCRSLDQSVSAALKDAGMSVQSTELNHVEAD